MGNKDKISMILYKLRPRLFDRDEKPSERVKAVEEAHAKITQLLLEERLDELKRLQDYPNLTWLTDTDENIKERIADLEAALKEGTK